MNHNRSFLGITFYLPSASDREVRDLKGVPEKITKKLHKFLQNILDTDFGEYCVYIFDYISMLQDKGRLRISRILTAWNVVEYGFFLVRFSPYFSRNTEVFGFRIFDEYGSAFLVLGLFEIRTQRILPLINTENTSLCIIIQTHTDVVF